MTLLNELSPLITSLLRGFMNLINLKYSPIQAKQALTIQKKEIDFNNQMFNMQQKASDQIIKEKKIKIKKSNKKGKSLKDEIL